MTASAIEPGRSTSVVIRRLGPDDWQDLRSARLAALRDSPDAFTADLGQEEARTPDGWRALAERSEWAGAWEDGQIVGIACLSAPEPIAPTRPFIESVWVTPQHRRHGLVREMLDELERSAKADGATHLQLWVLDTNDDAYYAYLKLDYHRPGRAQDSAKSRGDGTFVQENLMVKPLW